MKRFYCVILLLALLLLAGCSSNSEPYTVEAAGRVFTVDPQGQTLTDGTDVYRYLRDGESLTIIYPNGAEYAESGRAVTWDDDYDDTRYVSGWLLSPIVPEYEPAVRFPNLLAALVLGAFGVWSLISPYSVWYFTHGWAYKDAEPSDMALVANRVCGVVSLLFAVILLLV